jgi:large subunit ribosomal protein L4
MLLGALRSALTAKLRDGELKVVQAFTFAEPKAKQVRAALDTLEARKTVLLVDNSGDRNLELGSRNLAGVTLMKTQDVNAFHLLGHQRVLISEGAVKKLSEALK